MLHHFVTVASLLLGFQGSLCSMGECCSADGTGDSSHTALDRVRITVPYSNTSFHLRLLLSADNPQLAPGQFARPQTSAIRRSARPRITVSN